MNHIVIHGQEMSDDRECLVQARVDATVREEAAAVLADMGLNVSDAVRMRFTPVAREKALPFELLVPNAETVAAVKEARRGKLATFKRVDALMVDPHVDD